MLSFYLLSVVLKRLDDVADDVRCSAVGVLRLMFINLPEDYSIETSFSHIEALYATMLIHLDDQEESFRMLILGKDCRIRQVAYGIVRARKADVSSRINRFVSQKC